MFGNSVKTPQGEGRGTVRPVQRSWRYAPRLPGSASPCGCADEVHQGMGGGGGCLVDWLYGQRDGGMLRARGLLRGN
ncbi:MAG: hypothetical protein EPN77_07740 [Candidimonas sp.]|nr:MAG: hypothetical protein EPN77_07740 [Candidimonas sp.]